VEVTSTAQHCFVVRLRWRQPDDDKERQIFQVLHVRRDKIREIWGYRSARDAARAAKQVAANSD
jgi:hypothetical protein